MRNIAFLVFACLLLFSSSAFAQRTTATSNVDVYVSPPSSCTSGYWYASGGNIPIGVCGNDATADGTTSHPYATCQTAVNMLYAKYDFVGQYAPTIHLGAAASPSQFFYPRCALSGRLLGQPGAMPPLVVGPGNPSFDIGTYDPFTLIGDPTYPGGAFLVSGDFGFDASGPALSLSDGAALKVTGISLDSGASQQDCSDIMRGSFADISNILFGACGKPSTTSPVYSNYNLGVGIAFSSHVFITGPLTLANSDMGALFQLGQGSSLYPNNNGQSKINVAFGGGKFEAAAFVVGGNSAIYINGLSFSGSFTGNGLVNVENSTIENAGGPGPNTCGTFVLGHPNVIQDNSVCR